MSMEGVARLHELLDEGDLELTFHDGRSIKAHSFKLKAASRGGVLHNLIDDILEDQIDEKKRKRADLPSIKVRAPCFPRPVLAYDHVSMLPCRNLKNESDHIKTRTWACIPVSIPYTSNHSRMSDAGASMLPR